jgi:hypothetical protein
MSFRISGDGNGEAVDLPDEVHKLIGVVESLRMGPEMRLAERRVSPQGQNVLYSPGLCLLKVGLDLLSACPDAGKVDKGDDIVDVPDPEGDFQGFVPGAAPCAIGHLHEIGDRLKDFQSFLDFHPGVFGGHISEGYDKFDLIELVYFHFFSGLLLL